MVQAEGSRNTHHIGWINDDPHRGTVEDLFGRDSPRLFIIIILAPLSIIGCPIFHPASKVIAISIAAMMH